MKSHKQLINVFQLISSGGYFGAENVLVQLSVELAKSEICNPAIGVFENLQNPHLEIMEECRKHRIETNNFRCRGRFDFRTIRELRRFIQQRGIDIVHSHGYKASVYSFLATYGLPTSRIATCHNWLGDETRIKFYAGLDRFLLRKFSKVIAVSEDIRQKIIKSGVSGEKVTVIQNGISLSRFDNCQSGKDIRKELGITNATAVIGAVGRLSSEKGHRILLRAAKAILRQYPGTIFIIVGDGPLKKELERDFNSLSIIFTGMRNDIPDLYQCMDFLVLPSLTEGFPMVILEAMASKLPVVATRVGEIPLLVNRENGILVEPGDVEGIKEALFYLLENRMIAKGMGQKGYQRVKDHFSSEKMARDYMGTYRDVLNMS